MTRVAQTVLLGRTVDVVLIPWNGFSAELDNGAAATASVLYDAVRPDSMKARERLTDALRLYRRDVLERASGRWAEDRVHRRAGDRAPQRRWRKPARRSHARHDPAVSPDSDECQRRPLRAIDMTAGEKERGTMQTLLCAPIDSLEIIAGKFLAVWGISTMATLINLGSLAVTFTSIKMIPGVTMTVNPVSALLAFVLLMPVSMMVSALFVAVGAFAKDFKEGQAYLTPILMLLIFPLVATMLPAPN